MAKLFAYGSLQETDIQQNIFGRSLKGTPDSLIGYTVTKIEIEEEFGMASYPIITSTEKREDVIKGLLYEITDEELLMADTYEGVHYKRMEVLLESNQIAWAFTATN
ncbi:gamma-glutamylcyclotransferase [Flavobacterium faecale]|uniref:Gamma-glutamylcyclotransferase n=1 Tax=Flavobacterium faecale TaxID=1355330 RepID=A0A2S1LEJ2_9FLAO|nr:gamma-glutamylcyclotransferase family protein [Flavobacterium faecale]AWG22147.1 gamma-glutamylcyclotransferase [Flavobacterium faecale]